MSEKGSLLPTISVSAVVSKAALLADGERTLAATGDFQTLRTD